MKLSLFVCSVVLALCAGAAAAAEPGTMKEDKGHVYTWNRFTDDVYALHLKQLEGRKVRKQEELGGYAGRPAFYRQETFTDADSGKLLSVIQWQRDRQDTIHSISVYRYDEQGRLWRDYSSTYLPDYRNAPSQTLVFLHRYPAGVYAMRSFDASNDLLYERCEGEFEGEPVLISLDIDEIEAAMAERYQYHSGPLTEPAYLHCFGNMPDTARGVLPPQ